MVINCVLLSGWAWFTVLISMLSAIFYTSYHQGTISLDGSVFMPFGWLVFLPLLCMAADAYGRRQRALEALSTGACARRPAGSCRAPARAPH